MGLRLEVQELGELWFDALEVVRELIGREQVALIGFAGRVADHAWWQLPASAIGGVPTCSWNRRSARSGTRFPTCSESAVGSKPQ